MQAARWQHFLHREKQLLLMWLLGALAGMEFLENGMFVFASSHILGGIGVAPREFAQVQAAYAIGSMLMIAMQQWLSRHFGYRHYLLAALLLYALGDLASASAGNLAELTTARLVQGLGGGAFFISTRVLIPMLFSPALRPKATRVYMLSIFGVGAVGPVLSAWLVENWGWRWIFWAVLPLAAVIAAGVRGLLPRHLGRSSTPVKFSVAPVLLFVLAIGCVQWSFSEARYELFDSPGRLALVILTGVLLLGLFGIHQWKHDEPLLHLRDLTHPGFLVGIALYALYYFIVNFSNYLFPQFAEQGLHIPLITTGWLNSFSALISLMVAILYIKYAAKVTNKRALMMAGCVAMAGAAFWLSSVPPDAPISALCGALVIKGFFGVLMVLPVAALTFRALEARHFAKGYQSKNIMRQMMASFASAVAAVALQDSRFIQHGHLIERVTPSNPAAVSWLDGTQAHFEQLGYSVAEAHTAALVQLNAIVEQQALLLACQSLYQWLAAVAAVAAVVVMAQRHLR
ncbi:MFS transporter [Diaphorobacter caeni]|uniref:MFS transporter n=1 Tax=Diaphorobacter caeni TaxID=2784387 RepID=UPI00188FA72C|nr:MFS transporter [Diaphorobacter caeni]MBF5004953.1 MFS transporter [Diaphorobacter caeni]